MPKDKIKERQDISTILETLVPEFVTAEHPKMKVFMEKYYEFMESHQVYFEGIAFNEYKLVQEGEEDASIEPDYWIFEDEINTKLMLDGDPNEFYDPRVLEGGIVNHRIQLETERDTSKDDQLQFIIGETVYGNTTDAEAVVTGISGNTIAWLKPTTNTNFIYGEELTGVDSRAWTTFANGVVAGVFTDGAIEGFRTRGPVAATKELSEFQDIDRTVEGLIDDSWKPEFYQNVPKQAATDRRALLKQMREVYRSKGGENSYDWLFRAIFASQEVDYYYPKNDMMRLSDGKWTKDKTVKILTDTANNIGLFSGKEIRGLSSNATAIVEKTITKMVGAVQVTELFLSSISKGVDENGNLDYFTKYERVATEPDANGDIALGDCSGIIEDVTIQYGGSDYAIGDRVQFLLGGGADAKAEVTALEDDILKGFTIVDSGDGYFVGDKVDFVDGGTGGSGAAATVGTIIPTGTALKCINPVEGSSATTINSNNVVKPLFSNSSFNFTATIKENSGAVFGSSGVFFTSQFFKVGDLMRRQVTLDSTRVFTETGIGITLTQTGTTITLSDPITVDETKLSIGGKLTYANGNNNIICGQGNTTTLYMRDPHSIGSGQNFKIYYGDQSSSAPSATVVGANSGLVLYTLNSMHIDELGKKTINNFADNDEVILYDTSRNVLWGSPNANGSDAALTHTGFTFDIGNTPGNVPSNQFIIGDAFAEGGGYEVNQTNTAYGVGSVLTYTEHEFGSINSLAITNGGTGYQRLPIITVANNFMIGLTNSLEHTGDMTRLLNVNLHSYSTGTITQVGTVLTVSGGTFPDANSNPLHVTYANGFEDYVKSVASSTSLNMTTAVDVSTPESYTLTYMATANTFAPNDLIYTDDYSTRATVVNVFDEPGKQTFPRSIGKSYEGSYVEKPGQTGYMRRNIVNGNTTLRVDMLTTQQFTGIFSYILEEGPATAEGTYDRITFEDGGRIYPEDALTFILMEDSEYTHVVYEDGGRTFGEDVGSDRITAFDSQNTVIYSVGSITQTGNVITGLSGETTFPNESIRGTITYADGNTSIITGYTNATSITVADSKTINGAEIYSIAYNPASVYGANTGITAVADGRVVTVTEVGHTKTLADKIKVDGAIETLYNGLYSASPINSNSYSYTLPEDPVGQPDGGYDGMTVKFVKTSYLDTTNTSLRDTSLKGNNAVIKVSSIAAGAIKSVAVTDVGAGYSSKPTILAATGDGEAQMTAVIGAFAQYPGKYVGTQGRLDDAPKIQDSRYYQSFSYVLKAPIDTTKYRAHVDRLVHPAGMKMFGELSIILKASAELFTSGFHAGSGNRQGPGKVTDVDNYDDSGFELGRPDYLYLHTPRFHPIILSRAVHIFDAQIKTDFQPHVEIYTHDVPHHAMDGRIEHRGNVEIKREDFRDVESMKRTVASMQTFVMDASQGNDEQYEVGETVYQGISYFTRVRQAEVAGWNHATKTLNIINMSPLEDFDVNMNIDGYISGADYPILEVNTQPMAEITEVEHSHETGDIIQITRAGGATSDFFNGEYTIQTINDSNVYTVFLYKGDPGEGVSATAQTAYGGSYLKVETKSLANVWRVSSQNYESPFEGTITQEDELIDGVIYNYSITLEEGDTYLLPKIQMPEYDSGTVSIDMSFSSDLMLEEHINPDTGLHEDGYVLTEEHGNKVGMGPTRYISLEQDTEGIEWSYERGHLGHEPLSQPYMETQATFDLYENMGENLRLEDGSHFIEEGDETSRPLSRFMIESRHPGLHSTEAEHVLRPIGEIEFEKDHNFGWNFLLEDGHTRITTEGENFGLTGRELLLTEEDYVKTPIGEYEFNLYESKGYNFKLEDGVTHLIAEGDETANGQCPRIIMEDQHPGLHATEYEHGKRPVGEVELQLYENFGLNLQYEDDDHIIEEGDETSRPLSRFMIEGRHPGLFNSEFEHGWRPFGEIEYVFDLARPPFGAASTELLKTPGILGASQGWIQYEDSSDLGLEDGGTLGIDSPVGQNEASLDEIQFNLYEGQGFKLQLEDEISHFIEEGDETANGQCARFIMEQGHMDSQGISDVGSIQLDLEESTGWHFLMEDGHTRIRNEGLQWGTENGSLLLTEEDYVKSPFGQIIFELPPLTGETGLQATLKEDGREYSQHILIDRPFFNWHIVTEDDEHLVCEHEDLNLNWGLGTKITVEGMGWPNVYKSPEAIMIDKGGIHADNPMRVYKLEQAKGQIVGGDWMTRQIGTQIFGCQVGRARGSRQKYLDGVNHSGDPLQRGSLGKFGEDRTLDGDAYRQNYGEAGSIISGPGLNMNHPRRIGYFNQYWELMSIHHPIMLTGPNWWRDLKTSVMIYPTPMTDENGEGIITEGGEDFLLTGPGTPTDHVRLNLHANSQVELAQATVLHVPPIYASDHDHLQLEIGTADGQGYFELEQSYTSAPFNRINLNYTISLGDSSGSATTLFDGMTGQIEMAGGSTTVTGTDTKFQSELNPNDIIQTMTESIIIEDDEGIVFESNDRIEHETVRMDGLVEYSDNANIGAFLNIKLEEVRWYIATEETQGNWGNYHVGSGWDQETKTDVPDSYYIVGSNSISGEEIQLEDNTPHESSGVENKVITSETVWYQENMIWEDNTRQLLTQAEEFIVNTITNDTTLTVKNATIQGTDTVPFWKMASETETTAKVAGFNIQ